MASAAPAVNQQGQATAPARMALARVTRGKVRTPHRVLLFGVEGIGKTTFGAGAPAPIFLPTESGTSHVDVARFPQPETWCDVLDAVRSLREEAHKYETVVIDTLDAAEPMLWRHMIDRDQSRDMNGKPKLHDIEDYGYAKGYGKALDDWRILLQSLEALQRAKGTHVVLLAHSWIKAFKNPQGDDYDRFELKLHPKAAGLVKEWCDCVLFAQLETFAHKDEKKRVRGVDSGSRIIRTERRAAYDAKNRFGLIDTLPLSWADFDAASQQEPDAKTLREEILRKAAELGEDVAKKVAEAVKAAGDNTSTLVVVNNRVNTRLAEKAAQSEEN